MMDFCYIAVGAIVKNEERYIEEWIEYHRMIGVERFYIIDNGSTDKTLERLEKYVDEGLVFVETMIGNNMQLDAYNKIISEHKEHCKWIAFIDADEFICVRSGKKICEFLKDYEDANAVGINWICIGPSGHKSPVVGSLIQNYKEALPKEHKKICI